MKLDFATILFTVLSVSFFVKGTEYGEHNPNDYNVLIVLLFCLRYSIKIFNHFHVFSYAVERASISESLAKKCVHTKLLSFINLLHFHRNRNKKKIKTWMWFVLQTKDAPTENDFSRRDIFIIKEIQNYKCKADYNFIWLFNKTGSTYARIWMWVMLYWRYGCSKRKHLIWFGMLWNFSSIFV